MDCSLQSIASKHGLTCSTSPIPFFLIPLLFFFLSFVMVIAVGNKRLRRNCKTQNKEHKTFDGSIISLVVIVLVLVLTTISSSLEERFLPTPWSCFTGLPWRPSAPESPCLFFHLFHWLWNFSLPENPFPFLFVQ